MLQQDRNGRFTEHVTRLSRRLQLTVNAGFCEYGNEHLVFIKHGVITDQLMDYYLLPKKFYHESNL